MTSPSPAAPGSAPSLADAARDAIAELQRAVQVYAGQGARDLRDSAYRVGTRLEIALSADAARERLRREAADRMYDAVRALDDTRDLGARLDELRAAADELWRASR